MTTKIEEIYQSPEEYPPGGTRVLDGAAGAAELTPLTFWFTVDFGRSYPSPVTGLPSIKI